MPLERRYSVERVDDVSPGNLKRLVALKSPTVRNEAIQIYDKGLIGEWKPDSCWYMDKMENEQEYRERIKSRLKKAP